MVAERPLADEMGAVFARVSGLLLSEEVVDTGLTLLTTVAADMFAGTAGAGITLVDEHGNRLTAAATDPIVEHADRLQYELGQGPCLTAWEHRAVVRIDDTGQETRWPVWVREAAELGLRSALSAPLVAGAAPLGAMKLYGTGPGAYGERDEHRLTMFASEAAILLANMRTAHDAQRISDRLRDSIRARDVVTLAKGIIMARDGVDERAAFLTLADTAGQHGHTVRQEGERLARSTIRRRR
jgi:GAF domain-containing protein